MRSSLLIVVALALVACGGGQTIPDATPVDGPDEATPSEDVTDVVDETTEDVTDAVPELPDAETVMAMASEQVAHPVIHWEIATTEPDVLIPFYQELFGWSYSDMGDGVVAFHSSAEGFGIEGTLAAVEAEEQEYVTVYAYTESLADSLEAVTAGGGSVLVESMPIGWGTIALFTDPVGQTFGLFSLEGADPDIEMAMPQFAEATPIHWELNTDDDSVVAFYESVFDWGIAYDAEYGYGQVISSADVELPGLEETSRVGIDGGIAIIVEEFGYDPLLVEEIVDAGHSLSLPSINIFTQVANLDDALDRVVDLGGYVLMDPAEVMDGLSMAMYVDPAGNAMGLLEVD